MRFVISLSRSGEIFLREKLRSREVTLSGIDPCQTEPNLREFPPGSYFSKDRQALFDQCASGRRFTLRQMSLSLDAEDISNMPLILQRFVESQALL